MFGGWADTWFGDVFALDVGSVVGPPYAIMGLSPNQGPITGGQLLRIEGIDFVATDAVFVRFASPQGVIDAKGVVVSDTEIQVGPGGGRAGCAGGAGGAGCAGCGCYNGSCFCGFFVEVLVGACASVGC